VSLVCEQLTAEGIHYSFPRYVKQEQLPRRSWTRLCRFTHHSTVPAAVNKVQSRSRAALPVQCLV